MQGAIPPRGQQGFVGRNQGLASLPADSDDAPLYFNEPSVGERHGEKPENGFKDGDCSGVPSRVISRMVTAFFGTRLAVKAGQNQCPLNSPSRRLAQLRWLPSKGRIVAGPNAESLVADPLRPEARPAIVSQPSNRVRPNACSASNLFIASNFTWSVRAREGAPSQQFDAVP